MTSGVPGSQAPHGTYSRYRNHGCRCDECREAHTRYCRISLHNRGQAIPRDEYLATLRETAEARDNHGTETRYSFGCRCDLCREAARVARARRRAASAV